MTRAIKMQLLPGKATEYERRHAEIWPEMKAMISAYGGHDYSIFLDEKTGELFARIEIEDEARWTASAETEVCRRWWDYMSDIMEVNPDKSPVEEPLRMVFHMD